MRTNCKILCNRLENSFEAKISALEKAVETIRVRAINCAARGTTLAAAHTRFYKKGGRLEKKFR